MSSHFGLEFLSSEVKKTNKRVWYSVCLSCPLLSSLISFLLPSPSSNLRCTSFPLVLFFLLYVSPFLFFILSFVFAFSHQRIASFPSPYLLLISPHISLISQYFSSSFSYLPVVSFSPLSSPLCLLFSSTRLTHSSSSLIHPHHPTYPPLPC